MQEQVDSVTESAQQANARPAPVLLIFLIFPLLGLVIALAITLSSQPSQTATVVVNDLEATIFAPPPPGWQAPDFRLATLDGEPAQLSDYRGRVVFLNFWATYCEPCVREMPAFMNFAAQQGDDGAVVLAVNIAEPADVVRAWLTDKAISGFPILLDAEGDVFDAYNIQVLPTTYVIDPAGIARDIKFGEMTPDALDDYLQAALDSPA